MNRDRLSRHLLITFLAALVLYIVGYWFIESRRTVDAPWQAAFTVDADHRLTLEISEQSLNLGPVVLQFAAPVTNGPMPRTEVAFNQPRPVPFAVPVGQCIFQDTTFLPGTVVLHVGGVDIQMLPRALTIVCNEFPWHGTQAIEVQADGSSRRLR